MESVSVGGSMARRYATTVIWATICDYQWKLNTGKAIAELSRHPWMTPDDFYELNVKFDPFWTRFLAANTIT